MDALVFPWQASWSSHGHSAWVLFHVSPAVCTRASRGALIYLHTLVCLPASTAPPLSSITGTHLVFWVRSVDLYSVICFVFVYKNIPSSKQHVRIGWEALECTQFETVTKQIVAAIAGTIMFHSNRSGVLMLCSGGQGHSKSEPPPFPGLLSDSMLYVIMLLFCLSNWGFAYFFRPRRATVVIGYSCNRRH